MRRTLLAATAAIALCLSSGSALAKDSGLYGGVVIGSQIGTERNVDTIGTTAFNTLVPNIAPRQLKPKVEGVTYGGVLGLNFSSDGALVWGVEADVIGGGDFKSASFSGAPIPGLAPAGITTSATKEYSLRGSLRGRLGTSLTDEIFVYGTGGLAFAQVETKASVVANGAPTVAWNGANEETLTGWTLGAGAEFQINDGIILRSEYLYTDLGDSTVTAAGNSTVRGIAALNGIDYVARTDYRGGEVRLGLLFAF
ncbi:outer membrane beta-barrel protein [Aquidulcibacter sp.]|uniref:outer membrane protein n=1 Tax=Aquidulcibacter sp. TaxID=2052990 RepID=UPI0025C27A50|nr:outer membrane beta-barrel protein [Aquidulcibacter sp.]MCA3695004.1 porin family protein [Aquidulcibacter sp.]